MEAYGITVETDWPEKDQITIPGLGYYAQVHTIDVKPTHIALLALPQAPGGDRAVFHVERVDGSENYENYIRRFGTQDPFVRDSLVDLGGSQGTRARTNILMASFDILTFTGNGYFTQAEYALRGWGGGIGLTSQIIWSGWALGNGVFVPSRPCFAYPDADYSSMWRGMAECVEGFMADHNIPFASSSDLKGAKWNPPDIAPEQGWTPGLVTFSNLATGIFQIYDPEAGSTYRAYHTNVVGGGSSPTQMPPPMTGVYFRLNEENRVKSCKLAA